MGIPANITLSDTFAEWAAKTNQLIDYTKLHNDNGLIAPTSTNDNTEGYTVGSIWIDILTKTSYLCVDDTTASATWKSLEQLPLPLNQLRDHGRNYAYPMPDTIRSITGSVTMTPPATWEASSMFAGIGSNDVVSSFEGEFMHNNANHGGSWGTNSAGAEAILTAFGGTEDEKKNGTSWAVTRITQGATPSALLLNLGGVDHWGLVTGYDIALGEKNTKGAWIQAIGSDCWVRAKKWTGSGYNAFATQLLTVAEGAKYFTVTSDDMIAAGDTTMDRDTFIPIYTLANGAVNVAHQYIASGVFFLPPSRHPRGGAEEGGAVAYDHALSLHADVNNIIPPNMLLDGGRQFTSPLPVVTGVGTWDYSKMHSEVSGHDAVWSSAGAYYWDSVTEGGVGAANAPHATAVLDALGLVGYDERAKGVTYAVTRVTQGTVAGISKNYMLFETEDTYLFMAGYQIPTAYTYTKAMWFVAETGNFWAKCRLWDFGSSSYGDYGWQKITPAMGAVWMLVWGEDEELDVDDDHNGSATRININTAADNVATWSHPYVSTGKVYLTPQKFPVATVDSIKYLSQLSEDTDHVTISEAEQALYDSASEHSLNIKPPNLITDSGRFFASPFNDTSATTQHPFDQTTAFKSYNGSSGALEGSFIHDSNDYGGSAGSMTTHTYDLCEVIRATFGITTALMRYGQVWNTMTWTSGTGTLGAKTVASGTYYRANYSVKEFTGTTTTRGMWIKAIVNNVLISGRKHGTEAHVDDYELTPAMGWTYFSWEKLNLHGSADLEVSYEFHMKPSSTCIIAHPYLSSGIVNLEGGTVSPIPSTFKANESWRKFNLQFTLPYGENNTFPILESANFPFTIDVVNYRTTSGTITGAVKINGTNVTSMSTLYLNNTDKTSSSGASNIVADGDKVTLALTSNASANMVSLSLDCTRT